MKLSHKFIIQLKNLDLFIYPYFSTHRHAKNVRLIDAITKISTELIS